MLRILSALWNRADRAELDLIAAGVAFYGFLAIFPALAAVIALWGFASDPAVIRAQIAPMQQFLPADAFSLVSAQIEGLLSTNNRTLGWSSGFSLLLALWSSRAGVAALIRGLNAIHHLPNRTGIWHQMQAVILTLVLVALVLAAMLAAVVGPLVIYWLPLGPGEALALEVANVVLGATLLILAIGLIYRLGPNRQIASKLFT